MDAFLGLFKEWWIWAGIIAIVALIVLLFYIRKNGGDD